MAPHTNHQGAPETAQNEHSIAACIFNSLQHVCIVYISKYIYIYIYIYVCVYLPGVLRTFYAYSPGILYSIGMRIRTYAYVLKLLLLEEVEQAGEKNHSTSFPESCVHACIAFTNLSQ